MSSTTTPRAPLVPWECITRHLIPNAKPHGLHYPTFLNFHVYTESFAKKIKLRPRERKNVTWEPDDNRIASDVLHFARVLAERIRIFSDTERNKIEQLAEERLFYTKVFQNLDQSIRRYWKVRRVPDKPTHMVKTALAYKLLRITQSKDGKHRDDGETLWRSCPDCSWASMMLAHKTSRQSQCKDGNHQDDGEASKSLCFNCLVPGCFYFGDDFVKNLFNTGDEVSVLTLRHLAKGQCSDVLSYRFVNYGHVIPGWNEVAEHAILMYLFLHIIVEKELQCKGLSWFHSRTLFPFPFSDLTRRPDGYEQKTSDQMFFERWKADAATLPMIKEHMNSVFRRLYIFDWFVREAGGKMEWEREIYRGLTNLYRGFGMEQLEFRSKW